MRPLACRRPTLIRPHDECPDQPSPRDTAKSRALQQRGRCAGLAIIAPDPYLCGLPTSSIPASHLTLFSGAFLSVEESAVASIQFTILIRACGSPGPAAPVHSLVLTSAEFRTRYRQSGRPQTRHTRHRQSAIPLAQIRSLPGHYYAPPVRRRVYEAKPGEPMIGTDWRPV